MPRLFVYGTLQVPELLDRLLGRTPGITPAALPGWRAARLAGRRYPGLVEDPSTESPGAVIEVDGAELAVLDTFEGDQYERVTVEVVVAGRPMPAQAWRLRDEHRDEVLGEPWSLEDFLARDVHTFVDGARRGDQHPRGAS